MNGACGIPRTVVVFSRKETFLTPPAAHLTPHSVRTLDETRSSVTEEISRQIRAYHCDK